MINSHVIKKEVSDSPDIYLMQETSHFYCPVGWLEIGISLTYLNVYLPGGTDFVGANWHFHFACVMPELPNKLH